MSNRLPNTINGYTIHKPPKSLSPKTILFSKENEYVTVEMVKTAVDHILEKIAAKNQFIEAYKKAGKVFEAFKKILENKTPKRFSKEDAKVAIDVLEEIRNENTCDEEEKLRNSRMAFVCKLMIDALYL